MSRSSRAAKGFATGIVQFATQIAVQALLAPIVLKVAGRETLGAFAAIMQVVGLLALVDLSHAWSLERFLAQSAAMDDDCQRFRVVFTTARIMSLLSNALFALLVVIFSLHLGRLFGLSPHIAHQARNALWVIAVWAIVRTPLEIYNNALVALQHLAAVNIIWTITGVGRAVVSLVFVLAGLGLPGLILASVVVEGVGLFLYRNRFRQLHPTIRPRWGVPDRLLLREMAGFGAHAMFLSIGNMLMFTSGNAVAGFVGGAAAASTFYTTQIPATTGFYLINRLPESTAPAVNELWGRKQVELLKNSLCRLMRLTLLLSVPLGTGVLLFNRDLVTAWVGPLQFGGVLLTAALAAFCLIAPVVRIGMIYALAIGWVRSLTVAALVQGVANVALGIWFGRTLGLGGVALALVLVLLPQMIYLWVKLSRELAFNPVALVKDCVVPLLGPVALATICGLTVARISAGHGLFTVALECLVFAGVYVGSAYLLALNPQDRGDLDHYISKLYFIRKTEGVA